MWLCIVFLTSDTKITSIRHHQQQQQQQQQQKHQQQQQWQKETATRFSIATHGMQGKRGTQYQDDC